VVVGVCVQKFDIEILGGDLVKLRNLDWLSDQTINFYMEMLRARQQRNQSSPHVLPSQQSRIHYFNTFFYKKLSPDESRYVYKDVARWTKRAKVDLMQLDKIIIPVHVHGNHWCLAIINMNARRFEYYDSLGGSNPTCLQHLRQFVTDELKVYHPNQIDRIDIASWTNVTYKDIPRQNNGSDCGVFTIKFADYASENRPFEFTHKSHHTQGECVDHG
jgi:sentrin-specific protease 1